MSLASILEKSVGLLQEKPRGKGKRVEIQRLSAGLKDLLEFQIFALTILHHWIASNPIDSESKGKAGRRHTLDPRAAPLKSFQDICTDSTLLKSLENAAVFKNLPLLQTLVRIWNDPNADVELDQVEAILNKMKSDKNLSCLLSCKNCSFSFQTSLLKSLESLKECWAIFSTLAE